MQKSYLIAILLPILNSCADNSNFTGNKLTEQKPIESKQTVLTTSFKPAFLEHSTVIFTKDSGGQKISILIMCNRRMRPETDTFFYKSKTLTQKDAKFLDTAIIKILHIPIVSRTSKVVDGIGISFDLVKDKDSLRLEFHSPSKADNPVGYVIAQKTIAAFKTVFTDEIISNYFDDIDTYLDDSIQLNNSKERAIFKWRQKQYGR